eukprot:TRINITY_DN5771_c0_g1_i1.p1 TRINITY_DN5771_c0_g1~~TRINITY_DN5771_c0_g1_i1.p1  ORF type:complete len:431 (+),score=70.98 TRINITY_DN5771_c0_g1_i1:97-1389(+)
MGKIAFLAPLMTVFRRQPSVVTDYQPAQPALFEESNLKQQRHNSIPHQPSSATILPSCDTPFPVSCPLATDEEDFPSPPTITRARSVDRHSLHPLSRLRLGSMDAPSRVCHCPATRQAFLLDFVIGRGSMTTVYLAKEITSGERMALKQITGNHASYNKAEADLLSGLRHPNIVSYVGNAIDDTGTRFIVLEFVVGGTLRARLSREGGRLDIVALQRYAKNVADGLAYLHARNIVHGDVKPTNILIDEKTDTAKLADFGLSAVTASPATSPLSPQAPLPPFRDMTYYTAPEQLDSSALRRSADVWGFGVTFLEAATGEHQAAFAIRSRRNSQNHGSSSGCGFMGMLGGSNPGAVRQCSAVEPDVPRWLLPPLQRVLRQCLQVDAAARPTAFELTCYEFFSASVDRLATETLGYLVSHDAAGDEKARFDTV